MRSAHRKCNSSSILESNIPEVDLSSLVVAVIQQPWASVKGTPCTGFASTSTEQVVPMEQVTLMKRVSLIAWDCLLSDPTDLK